MKQTTKDRLLGIILLLISLFAQRFIVEGMTAGAVKG